MASAAPAVLLRGRDQGSPLSAGDDSAPTPGGVAPVRLLRKLKPAEVPVDGQSIALFRLGEACNNACPMCSNSGRPEAFFIEEADLLRRVDYLNGLGMPRVVLTGGEPTIHPAFWAVVAALGERGMVWDINSHGRSFSDAAFARRAAAEGLRRAIISLHSHRADAGGIISGVKAEAHEETVAGIEALVSSGVWVMLNCVVTTHNLDLDAYVRWCTDRFGTGVVLKLCFPSTGGKGGAWGGIADVSLAVVQGPLRAAVDAARQVGASLAFEGFPNCVLGSRRSLSIGRSGFGETHYLDDITGDRLYPIEHIESVLSAYPEPCSGCRALRWCPGVAPDYVRRFGIDELVPFV